MPIISTKTSEAAELLMQIREYVDTYNAWAKPTSWFSSKSPLEFESLNKDDKGYSAQVGKITRAREMSGWNYRVCKCRFIDRYNIKIYGYIEKKNQCELFLKNFSVLFPNLNIEIIYIPSDDSYLY